MVARKEPVDRFNYRHAVTIEFDFVGPVWAFGQDGNTFGQHWRNELGRLAWVGGSLAHGGSIPSVKRRAGGWQPALVRKEFNRPVR